MSDGTKLSRFAMYHLEILNTRDSWSAILRAVEGPTTTATKCHNIYTGYTIGNHTQEKSYPKRWMKSFYNETDIFAMWECMYQQTDRISPLFCVFACL